MPPYVPTGVRTDGHATKFLRLMVIKFSKVGLPLRRPRLRRAGAPLKRFSYCELLGKERILGFVYTSAQLK